MMKKDGLSMDIEIKGMDKLLKKVSRLQGVNLMQLSRATFFNLSQKIKALFLRKFSEPKSGRWYNVPGTQTPYQASAPGQFPAKATGHLAQSTSFEVSAKGDELIIRAGGASASHAVHLEEKPPSRGGRPWFLPTIQEGVTDWKTIMRSEIEGAIG
jgi:hypothetical protein